MAQAGVMGPLGQSCGSEGKQRSRYGEGGLRCKKARDQGEGWRVGGAWERGGEGGGLRWRGGDEPGPPASTGGCHCRGKNARATLSGSGTRGGRRPPPWQSPGIILSNLILQSAQHGKMKMFEHKIPLSAPPLPVEVRRELLSMESARGADKSCTSSSSASLPRRLLAAE